MFYAIRHFTRYVYSNPVRQSMMEVRMHPRSEHAQRCFTFQLTVSPAARVFSFTDYLGNVIHHFDIPGHHRQLTIIADSLVDIESAAEVPESLGSNAWLELDQMTSARDYWDMLMPSRFARPSPQLDKLAREFKVASRAGQDPLQLLLRLSHSIHSGFEYVKSSTAVDSPIEDALKLRRGVCQDFAHIMITLARRLGIPCRYVSGYLYQKESGSNPAGSATHAWLEAMLPGLGWVGFDPTHDVLVSERHVRTAIGRDYADVPPTTGTMKGAVRTELQVRVRVSPSEALLPPDQEFAADEEWSRFLEQDSEAQLRYTQQQQQQ